MVLSATARAFVAGICLGALIGGRFLGGRVGSASSSDAGSQPESAGAGVGRNNVGKTGSRLGSAAEGSQLSPMKSGATAEHGLKEFARLSTVRNPSKARSSRSPGAQKAGAGAFNSIGKVRSVSGVDIASPGGAEEIAKARSYRGELIMFTSDASMGGWSYHFVLQLRAAGYEHWLILADRNSTCSTLQSGWAPMVKRHSEAPLSCVYSSYPRAHPGWAQWTPRAGEDSLHNVYILWSTRWWVAWKLLQQDVSVLSLDVDAVLLMDIYPLLHGAHLGAQDVIITRNADGSQSLNCGFVYFNLRPSQRGRETRNDCEEPAAPDGTPAAEWVAELMWERIRLFLDLDATALARKPRREVLWEQDVWNDLAKSIEKQRRIFPWAVGYGLGSDLWAALGYERRVEGGATHREKWITYRERPMPGLPAWPVPDEPTAQRFFATVLRKPLLVLPMCAPKNASAGADANAPAGTKEGIPLGLVSRYRKRAGQLAIAPAWLASLGADPEADWAASKPPAFAYLHLTNMWHCFPHVCWSKAGRLFWLRAHGFWDTRLDQLAITPRGPPFRPAETRVLSLPPTAFDAIAALVPKQKSSATRISADERGKLFRRLHALLHNLALVAALLGRRPVVPDVPCEFIRAVQPQTWATDSSRFGVSHAAVVATGDKDSPICHVTPGTWRPGAPDQCYHSFAMSGFDFRRFLQRPRIAKAKKGVIAAAAPRQSVAANASVVLGEVRALCAAGAVHAQVPVLLLEGLLPPSGALLDSPLDAQEIDTERERKASNKPRWRSVLQKAQLRELADVCPGAKDFLKFRLACVGYFMAE